MNSIEHYNRNYSFGKPSDMNDEECHRLHVQVGKLPIGPEGKVFPVIVSGWKLSAEELKQVQETGIVWLSVAGGGMPPVMLHSNNPLPPLGQSYDTRKDAWVHGELVGDTDARCLGPCPQCGERTISTDITPGAAWHCTSVYCDNYNNVPAAEGADLYPWWWNKGFLLRKDGVSWMAAFPDFVDLAISPAGFAETPDGAITALLLEVNARKQ